MPKTTVSVPASGAGAMSGSVRRWRATIRRRARRWVSLGAVVDGRGIGRVTRAGGGGRRLPRLRAVRPGLVEGGRSRQLDDRIGYPVVSIRRRQVDDLEVAGQRAEEPQRLGRPSVVEGHERVVEDERRSPVAGDEADEAEPGREVDLVEGALAELPDVDPARPLGREHGHVEGPVVDLDPSIPSRGDPGDVADHRALEVAGGGPHRRLLGLLDGGQRLLVDPVAALVAGELIAPRCQPLGLTAHLLGVDRVRLDPGTGVRFVVPGAIEGALLVADLRLEPFAGPRLPGDRPERGEGAPLLLDLEGRRITERRQRLGRLPPDEAVELGGQLVDVGDVGLLLVKQRFGGGDVGQADRRELGLRVELGLAQLLLDLGAAPKAAVDLLAGKLFLRLQIAGGRALAAGEDGDDDADDDEADADRQEEAASWVTRADAAARPTPMTTRMIATAIGAFHVGSGAETS